MELNENMELEITRIDNAIESLLRLRYKLRTLQIKNEAKRRADNKSKTVREVA